MAEAAEAGHRKRLRERFLAGESGALSDEALLELLLTFTIDRKDVKPLAQELIRVFGSLPRVLSAAPNEVLQVKGLGRSSIALLQLVNFIRSDILSTDTVTKLKETTIAQPKLFGDGEDTTQKQETNSHSDMPTKKQSSLVNTISTNIPEGTGINTQNLGGTPPTDKANRRKFQVSNGYLLEFDQLARVLHFLLEHKEVKKISRKVLQDDSGLSDRQIGNLISMGSAMGLIRPSSQVLTPVGLLIAENDIFIEKQGTLEWCHYIGAGSYRNLVWFEIFNHLLLESSPMTQNEWQERLRSELTGKLTPKTLGKGLREEVRFVVDAYVERNFNKLGLLHQSPGDRIYRRRYTNFIPMVLTAMIYDFCVTNDEHLSQVAEMATTPGSPAMVFGLDIASFRQQIEGLHERGWIRYETTHNLDQIRLKPGFSVLEFLTAHFEDRAPHQALSQSTRGMIE